MGEWGPNTREIKLIEFQQWVGKKIPREEDEDYNKPFSTNQSTIRWRRWKEKKQMSKQDYKDLLNDLKENAKKKK